MKYLLLMIAPLLWSGNFVLSKGVNAIVPPVALAYWRWITAGIILIPFTYKKVIEQMPIIKKHIIYLSILSFLGVASFNSLVYIAAHYTTAINAVLVNSFVPVLILIISLALYKDKPTMRQIIGIIVSLLGVAVIMVKGNIMLLMSLSFNKGDLLVLVAALAWSIYTVLLKSMPKEIDSLVFLQTIIILGIIFLTPLYLFEMFYLKEIITFNIPTLLSVIYVGLFASVISFILWNRAVKEFGANNVGPYVHLMPVFGSILAVIFLNEKFSLYHFVGIFFVFLGILAVSKK